MATTYRPTSLTFNGTSWRGASRYNAADIPVVPGMDRTVLDQQIAYERYDQSGRYSDRSNPPFTTAAAGRLLPDFVSDGNPRRILRGFIRRSDYDVADTKSTSRLYFMYNPETITRDYVSYLDQGALDPFNSVFQSGNLVAPPSFMDFNFSLLFDRQEEAAHDGQHPGVFVDYEYFDLVVRNVIPSYDPGGMSSGGSELPDNGVMMVNPRDITVVFSPNITVQGRPSNAKVSFLKFTHRMIPTRMQIDLTMRVTYFGPMRDMVEYKAEEAVVSNTVPWMVGTESPFTITTDEIQANAKLFQEKMVDGYLLNQQEIAGAIDDKVDSGTLPEGTQDLTDTDAAASGGVNGLNASIAEHGLKYVGTTKYAVMGGPRQNLWDYADCSSWVWGVFATHPAKPNLKMGGEWTLTFENRLKGHAPSTDGMLNSMANSPVREIFRARSSSTSERSKVIKPNLPLVMKGDLLFRKKGVVKDTGHVAIVYSNDGKYLIDIIHCGGPKTSDLSSRVTLNYDKIANSYTDCYRPMLGNPDTPGNRPLYGNGPR